MSGDADRAVLGAGDGILLIGHGTRDAAGTAQFFQLGQRLAEAVEPLPVEACLLELQPPTIAQGWQRLLDQGVTRVHAAPLLLFAAGHAKTDIPQQLAKCQATSPTVNWDQSRPLSRAAELIELAIRRVAETIQRATLDPLTTAIVLVGRGSYDPCAQADMRVFTECVAARWPFRVRRTAFYAMAEPKLPTVLQQIAVSGEVSDVLVQPHLLFEGAIHQSIRQMVDQASGQYPAVRFWCSDYLGPEPELVDALLRRIKQAAQPSSVSAVTR